MNQANVLDAHECSVDRQVSDSLLPLNGTRGQISQQTLNASRQSLVAYKQAVAKKLRNFKCANNLLVACVTVFGLIATVTAGAAGIGGEEATGAGGWQIVCYVAALFALLGSITNGLSGSLRVPETVARCSLCKIELDNLLTDFEDAEPTHVIASIKKLRATYPDLLADVG